MHRHRILMIISRNSWNDRRLLEYMKKDSDIDVAYVDLPLVCPDWAKLWPAFKTLMKALPSINRYDVVVSCSLINGLCLAVLQSLSGRSLIRPRHIVVDAGGTRYLSNAGRFLLFMVRWVTSSVSVILCYSGSSREFWEKRVRFRGECSFEYLFADAVYFDFPRQSEERYILSAGKTDRDYDTLVEAFDGIHEKLVILGDKDGYESVSRRTGNSALIDYQCEKYGEFYNEMLKKARFVVIPLRDSAYHAGQTVLVQAMAAGKTVIATRSPGTIEYITDGVDGLLVEGGNAGVLRAAVLRLLNDEEMLKRLSCNAAEKARRFFSEKRFAERLRSHIVRAAGKQ